MSEEKLEYQIVKAKARKPGLKAKATITDVRLLKAGEVYGEGARDPEQLVYALYANVDGWQGRIGTINKPPSKQISAATRMAQFKVRYKRYPEPGLKVDVIANEKGYWQMVV